MYFLIFYFNKAIEMNALNVKKIHFYVTRHNYIAIYLDKLLMYKKIKKL